MFDSPAQISAVVDALTAAGEHLIVRPPDPPAGPAEDLLADSIGRIEGGPLPFLPAEACADCDCVA